MRGNEEQTEITEVGEEEGKSMVKEMGETMMREGIRNRASSQNTRTRRQERGLQARVAVGLSLRRDSSKDNR